MGILRADQEELAPERLEDSLGDYLLETESEGEERATDLASVHSLPITPRRRKERGGKGKWRLGAGEASGGSKSGCGQRKLRRAEAARALAALAEDVCEDLSDLLPDSASSFAQLFQDPEAMETWRAFVAASEEEQSRILAGESEKEAGNRLGGGTNLPHCSYAAFSAEAAFGRMDGRLRQLLTRSQVPKGKLEWREEELRDFFTDEKDGVWLGEVESSYDRLLTHAVAQWLGLRSHSLPLALSEQRQTEVENPRPYFIPPSELLVPFLERRRRRRGNSSSSSSSHPNPHPKQ